MSMVYHKVIFGCWRVVPIFTIDELELRRQADIVKIIQCMLNRHSFHFSIDNPLFSIRYEVEYMSPTLDQVFILTLSACVESYNNAVVDADQQVQQKGGDEGPNSHLSSTLQQLYHLVPTKEITSRLQYKLLELIVSNEEDVRKRTNRRHTWRGSLRINFLDIMYSKDIADIDNDTAVKFISKNEDVACRHSRSSALLESRNEEREQHDVRQSFLDLFVVESAPYHYSKYLTPKDMDFCEWQSGDAEISYPTRTLSLIEFQESHARSFPSRQHLQSTSLSRSIANCSVYDEFMDEEFRKALTIGFVHIINFGSVVSNTHVPHPHVQKKVKQGYIPLIATVWNSARRTAATEPSQHDTARSLNTYAVTLHETFSHNLRCLWKLKSLNNKVQCLASKLITIRTMSYNSTAAGNTSPFKDTQQKKLRKENLLLLILGFENGDIATIEIPADQIHSTQINSEHEISGLGDNLDDSFVVKSVSSCKLLAPKVHCKEISSISIEGDKVYVASFDKSFSILQININSNGPNNEQSEPYPVVTLALVDHPLAHDHFTNNMVHHDVLLAIAPFPSKPSRQYYLHQPYEWDQLFTSSWDTKIRYWKRELAVIRSTLHTRSGSGSPCQYQSKWISFVLPPEHSKKVGCLAIYDFSSRNRHFTDQIGGAGIWSRVLVSGSADCTAVVWDISNPMRPMKVRHLQGHDREVVDVKIFPHDYDYMPIIVTASADKSIRFWDMISGQVFRLLPHDQSLFHGSFDVLRLDRCKPSGDIIVSINQHGHAIAVWNFLANHRQTRQFTDPVSCLTVLQDDDEYDKTKILDEIDDNLEETGNVQNAPVANIEKHVPIIIGTYLGQSIISVKGKTRQVLDDSSTVLIPESTLTIESRSSSSVAFNNQLDGVSVNTNAGVLKTVVSASTDEDSASAPQFLDSNSGHWSASSSSAAVRVSSITNYRDVNEKTDFIVVGLLNGMVSIWKRDRNRGDYQKHCYFQDNNKGVFAVAMYDPTHGLPNEDCQEPLLLVGGITDGPHVWLFNELIKQRGFIVNTVGAIGPMREYSSTKTDRDSINFHNGHPPFNQSASYKTGTIRTLLIHYMPKVGISTICVTGDFQSRTIVWRIKDMMPLIMLEGLHKTDAVFALSLYDPTASWRAFEEAEQRKNSLFVEHLSNFDLDPSCESFDKNEQHAKHNCALPAESSPSLKDMNQIFIAGQRYPSRCTLFIVTGGYDGNIGLWPIELNWLTNHENLSHDHRWSNVDSVKSISQKASTCRGSGYMESNWSKIPQSNTFSRMHHDNQESVTSLTVHVPRRQSEQGIFSSSTSPLIITGSIDHAIYVWDLSSQQKVHVLTGHSGRITGLITYQTRQSHPSSDERHSILVSGSDDGSTTFWEDGLQRHRYPPSRSVLLRTFYRDVEFHRQNHCHSNHIAQYFNQDNTVETLNTNKQLWKQMKLLRSMYPTTNLFMEFPHMFYLALIERQESFFLEFLEDLQVVLTRIPSYKRFQPSAEGHLQRDEREREQTDRVDILAYAIETNSLIAIRTLLFCWQQALNQNIEDSLSQKLLLTSRMFSTQNLNKLGKKFPVEYADFLCSLRLVRLHSTAESIDGKWSQSLPAATRQLIVGSNGFMTNKRVAYNGIDADRQQNQSWWRLFRSFHSRTWSTNKRQSVTAFLLPLKGFADVQHFSSVIRVCDQLNNRLELFESPIVTTALTHYWAVHGWKVYFLHILQYLVTLSFFVFCIYSFQYASTAIYHNKIVGTRKDDQNCEATIINARRAHFAFLLLLLLYGVDEVCKLVGAIKPDHIHTEDMLTHKINLYLRRMIRQCVGNVWSTIDIVSITSALLGTLIRYDLLLHFSSYETPHRSFRDNLSSCILSITAVALWFKILYFLRPIKTAGQFVAMVCTIMNDIKCFLFVLVCVLTGFSQGFWLLMNNPLSITASSSGFQSIKMSYFSTIMFMFGEINLDDLEGSKSLAFTRVFLVAFMLTMMILMLNLLIALMGDSFARTKENIEKIYWKELASLIIDQSRPTLLLHILTVLNVLQYEKDAFIHVIKYTSNLEFEDPKTASLQKNAMLEKSLFLCRQSFEDHSAAFRDYNQTVEILDRYQHNPKI